MQPLLDALKLKFQDSALWNYVGGRVYYELADSNEYPHVVYHIVWAVMEKTFTETCWNVLIQFDLFSAKSAGEAELITMHANLITLFDECSLIITGHTLLRMNETNYLSYSKDLETPLPDGSTGLYHGCADYEVLMSNG